MDFKHLADSNNDPVVALDRDGHIIYLNPAAERVFGITHEQAIGKALSDLVPQAHSEPFLASIEKARHERTQIVFEEFYAPLKRWFWVCAQGHEGGAYITIRDITAQKEAEESRRESEERFRFLSEMAVEGIVIHEGGTILDANAAYAQMYGYAEPVELIGTSIARLHTAESHETILRHIQAGYQGLFEIVGVKKDGTSFPVEVMGRNAVLQGRRVRVVVMRDLTQRRRAQEAEAERTAVLEENTRLLRAQAETALLQRAFLRDVLYSVTEGRLHLCDSRKDLPASLAPVGEPIPLSAPALRQVRRIAQDAACEQGLPDERVHDLVSAVSECSMNAFQHGGGVATARVCAQDGTVQVWVEDQGKGIAVSDLPKATLMKGHSGAGSFGHGFYMMLQTMDAVYLLTGPQGTTVVLEQAAAAPLPAWLQLALGSPS